MIRRTFRMGLRMGLLAGVVFALFKLAQSRRPRELPDSRMRDNWPPVPVPDTVPALAPKAPAAEAPAAKVEVVAKVEPAMEQGHEVEAPPVATETPAATPVAKAEPRPAPAKKKAVAKKAAATSKTAKKTTKAVKKAAKAVKKSAPRGWVTPQGDVCPLSHPIKAKVASRIYHLPGMFNYTRTRPDRCYGSETAAKRDGFSVAKR